MKKIIIASKNLHFQILNKYRVNDPFLDVKIYSLSEIKKMVYPSYGVDALIYLLTKKKYPYEIAKMYLSILPYILKDNKEEKLHLLYQIKEELKDNNLEISPLDNDDIYQKEVDIISYSIFNNELNEIIKALKLLPNYIKNDKDIAKKEIKITTYTRLEDEVYSVLNQIASLIDKGTNINDIYIIRRNHDYDYYLKKYAKTYGYELNLKEDISYYSLGGFKEFKKIYKQNHDINLSLDALKEVMQEDDTYEDIKLRILDNILDDVPFEIQYDYLINRFKEMKINTPTYDKAVKVIDHIIYQDNKYVFVMGFAQGQYPKKSKSNPFLDNETLLSLGILNSKNKIKDDQDTFINFMKSNNHIYYSFSYKSLSGNYYLSPISKIFDFDICSPILDDIYYSKDTLHNIYLDLKDNATLYNEYPLDYFKIKDVINLNYLSYDNSFKNGPKIHHDKSKIKISYTKLDKYNECPFRYYLDYEIKLIDFEANYYSSFGNIAHHLIENRNKPDYDYDKEFDQQLLLESKNYPFDLREKFLINAILKNQIKEAIKAIDLRESYYNKLSIDDSKIYVHTVVDSYPEKDFEIYLDPLTILEGRIDSFSIFDNEYFVCIDYKTGSTSFDPKMLDYGKSTQLPTYIYMVKHDKKYQDLKVGGIYINHLISSNTKDKKLDTLDIYSHLQLQGSTLNDTNFIYAFDQSLAKGNDSFIQGIRIDYKTGNLKGSSLVGEEVFDEYQEKVEEHIKNMAASIRKNEYPINPLIDPDNIRNVNACEYCPYHDICYRRKEQFRNPKPLQSEEDIDGIL